MLDSLLISTMIMAYLCTILSSSLAIYFVKHRDKPLGKAVCIMLIGEALGMAVIAIFATLEFGLQLEHFSPWAASAIRWVAMLATAFSSIHLAKKVINIIKGIE